MHVYGEERSNEYSTKAASSVKGALGLIEAAFEKDYGIDGVHV